MRKNIRKKKEKDQKEKKKNEVNTREIVVNRRINNGTEEPVRELGENRENNNSNEKQNNQPRQINSLYTSNIENSLPSTNENI